MPRRTNLASLLDEQPAGREPGAVAETDGLTDPAVPGGTGTAEEESEQQAGGDPDAGLPVAGRQLPRYLQLERKELRVRADQYDDLTALTRRLNRARGRRGERITENTLIRVAIDVLLQRRERLAGSTEDELRDSVGTGVC